MNSITIERYKIGQEAPIYRLIRKVFDEFVAIDYSDEGNRFFYDWIEPSKIAQRQQKQRTILCAMAGSTIVGIIETRDNNHIALLFVDKEYQGQGIAKSLFREALKECIQRDSRLEKFSVNASPFSIPVYKKMGFVEMDTLQEKNGIKFLPMEMTIGPSFLG